jgi:PAS domain S-box-containing protein
MEDKNIKVLLIEDNPDDAELMRRKLVRSVNGQFTVTSVTSLKDGLEYLTKDGTDLVISDLGLPDSHGLDTVTKILCEAPHIPLVMLSGFDDEATAIKAVQYGAQDYLVKGQMEGNQIERALFYAIERSRLQRELEQYTQELEKTQANLYRILEKNADAIIVVGKDRRTLFVNPAAVSLLGYSKKDLLSKPFGFPLKGGKASEININRQGGETTIAEMRVVVIDWEGKPAYLASLRDITERKRAEAALLESEQFNASLLENAPNPVTVINPDTSIKYVSPSFEKLTGFTSAEVVGQKAPYPWWQEESVREFSATLAKDMVSGSNILERSFQKKNGERFWAASSAVSIKHNGTLMYFLVNWVDITERKQAEARMRELDLMKSEFLSNVSHELRNPLHSARGFVKLMLAEEVPEPTTQKEFLTIINKEMQRLTTLIDDLLDMSRLEAGTFQIQKQRLPIWDVIHEEIISLSGLARDKDMTINEDMPPTLPEIEADGNRIKQVIDNLLGNAIKFSDGGSITVKSALRDGEVMVQVTDQGIGIPEEALPYLFERFFRAKDDMARGGTGLGLYISKQIVEAHGGRIWVESKEREGSTFSFTLPYDKSGGDSHE